MKQTLTLVCKLQPTPEQVAKIEATLKAFADGCNYANQTVKPSVLNGRSIQSVVYDQLRTQFGLSANLAVRACARVGANRKAAKSKDKPVNPSATLRVKSFQPTSADYDARIFAFREKDWTASLTLIGGREHIRLVVGNYQTGKLTGRKPTSAQLCKHRDGLYYLHIQLTDIAPEPIKSTNVIGVDFGRRSIAVTSNGGEWDGESIKNVRDDFAKVRASLQSKSAQGTRATRKGCRRALKRLSGRERRYQTWLNHTISKAIVRDAKETSAIIAIEDLTGIRKRTNSKPRNKTERRHSNSWSYYQLRTFLEYKGVQAGVEVIAVPPAYTSQTCHQCLHIGLRSDKVFKCGNCSWHGDADFNAANMISLLGGSASGLERAVLACSLDGSKASAKAHP